MSKVPPLTRMTECDVVPHPARAHGWKISAVSQLAMMTKCKINQVTVLCLAGPPDPEITIESRSSNLR